MEDAVVRVGRFFIRSSKINRILTFVCYPSHEVEVFRQLLSERGRVGICSLSREGGSKMPPCEGPGLLGCAEAKGKLGV